MVKTDVWRWKLSAGLALVEVVGFALAGAGEERGREGGLLAGRGCIGTDFCK